MSAFVDKAMSIAGALRAADYRALRAHLEAREAVTRQLAETLLYVIEHNRVPDGYARAIYALQAYDEASK